MEYLLIKLDVSIMTGKTTSHASAETHAAEPVEAVVAFLAPDPTTFIVFSSVVAMIWVRVSLASELDI